MVGSCPDLEQYVQFLQLVEEARAAGHENPLRWAIQEAVRRNILRDYLERKGDEVLSILMTEYDYATDMAVQKEEAYEDGLFVGREEGISIGLATGREGASPSGWSGVWSVDWNKDSHKVPTRRHWRRPSQCCL